MDQLIFRVFEADEARKTLLKRTLPDELTVPEQVLARIEQAFGERLSPAQAVAQILRSIRLDGDSALHEWTRKLDHAAPLDMRVPAQQIEKAYTELLPETRQALINMASRIEAFHRKQPLASWLTQDANGTLGQLIRPIRRVGLYVPAGTAPLPSSVLMSAVPAKVAGVSQIAVVSPPMRGSSEIAPIILAACYAAGIDEVYAVGGAQAIAALAFGTQTIPAVDKIFGPGNLFVTLAKQQVFGIVGIDGLAGPTETVIIADESANPAWVAADLLAQAEHDPLAAPIMITPSRQLVDHVRIEIGRQIEHLPRVEIVLSALANQGGAVITQNLEEAVELANRYAPEHLCLATRDPWRLSELVSAAGGIFLGDHSFEVLGDYQAGPSHVMPTGGTARFASPLNVWDFVHIISLVALNSEGAAQIIPDAIAVARAEGLEGHARAAEIRLE
jgi:histidinol dehydrogenase